jgi:ribosomal protein S18 acetylase RimI-like enzyme
MMNFTTIIADYHNTKHCDDIVWLMNHYAQDVMGGSTPLSSFTQKNLTNTLATLPHAITIICYLNQQAVGLINGFEGFSTFACKPLINIHDVIVKQDYRGKGISYIMLDAIEAIARERNCCRLTLEVLEGNPIAQRAYQNHGFSAYELDPSIGNALFWQKAL